MIVIGHEISYFILSSMKKDKIRYTKNWFWLSLWYLPTLLTTKLEFRIGDISVEFGVHICKRFVLNKEKEHFLRHILSNKEYTFLYIVLNYIHRNLKCGRILRVLSSITDMSFWPKFLSIATHVSCLYFTKYVAFCCPKQYIY